MTPEDEIGQKLRLDHLGKVYKTVPPERGPSHPRLKESPDFVKRAEPGPTFEFGIGISVPKQ